MQDRCNKGKREDQQDSFGFLALLDGTALLAFRGTAVIQDWLTDGTIRQTSAAGCPGLVHRGFAAAQLRGEILQL